MKKERDEIEKQRESFRASLPFLFDDKLKALALATSQQHRLAWLAGKLPDPYFPPSDSLSSSVFPCDEFLTPEDKVVLDSLQVNQSHADPQGAFPSPHPRTPPFPSSPSLSPDLGSVSAPRILCLIYTISPSHSRVRGVAQTWGKRCDGFLALSNQSDPRNGILSVRPAFQDWEESYYKMWPKVQAIWRFVAGTLSEEFDFFLIGGDDLYVIVENLRAYLSSEEVITAETSSNNNNNEEEEEEQQANNNIDYQGNRNVNSLNTQRQNTRKNSLFLGRRIHQNPFLMFQSGGAGYILNREALIDFASMSTHSSCLPLVLSSMEDVLVANCLRQLNIHPRETAKKINKTDPVIQEREYSLKHVLSQSSPLKYPEGIKEKQPYPEYFLHHRFHPLSPGEAFSLAPSRISLLYTNLYPLPTSSTLYTDHPSSSPPPSSSSSINESSSSSSQPIPSNNPLEWFPRMSDSFSSGLGCCSRDSVSFQNVKGEHYQRCLHHRLYNRYEGR